ncbi:MAG: purine-binding chemotaxis protein CheW [Geobacter sp.]|nr:purine-binding chemotaxis protein CheW [Geobacter sp.]
MERERNNAIPDRHQTSDWDELRRRLTAAREAISREPTRAEKQSILMARAAILAQDPAGEETAADYAEVLEFRLAHELYGIETTYVSATAPLLELTPIPGTPPFLLGLINHRGQILSVIDLKKFFDLPDKGLTDLNKVIVVQNDEMEFGVLADEIAGVRQIRRNEIQPALPTLTGVREEYLLGVSRERTVLLDGRRLLADRSLVINDEE